MTIGGCPCMTRHSRLSKLQRASGKNLQRGSLWSHWADIGLKATRAHLQLNELLLVVTAAPERT